MELQYSPSPAPSLVPVIGERMGRARMPDPSAFSVRTSECPGYHQFRTATVEIDPMKSAAILWLGSHDLRPPT
jgi:hypothetical protein